MSGGIAPPIHNLNIIWRWLVSFTTRESFINCRNGFAVGLSGIVFGRKYLLAARANRYFNYLRSYYEDCDIQAGGLRQENNVKN